MASANTTSPDTSKLLERVNLEMKMLKRNRANFYQAICDEQDIRKFYFLLRPLHEPYIGGLYIGYIYISDKHPYDAGEIYMLTPSGRFTVGTKICMDNTSYHRDNYSGVWNIMTIVIGFMSSFTSDDDSGISHIKDSTENRKNFAKHSIEYNINKYPDIFKRFDYFVNPDMTIKSSEEIDEDIAKNIKKPKKTVPEL